MSDVVSRLAADDPNGDETWAGTAVVTDDAAGTTTDGRLLITISWRGTEIDAAYLASYTPVVGHRVTFIKAGPSLLVLGRPATV